MYKNPYEFDQVAKIIIILTIIAGLCYGIYDIYNLPKNTIRDWTNTALRHGYCWVRMCDEFHRCPVWDDREERCIFLPVDKAKAKEGPTKYKEMDWTDF